MDKPRSRYRKTMSNDDFMYLWSHATQMISRDRMKARLDEAIGRILKHCSGKIAYGWSGGKDSVALQIVMELAGIGEPFYVQVKREMMKASIYDWMLAHQPQGCTLVEAEIIDWPIFHRYPIMLFPSSQKGFEMWNKLYQWDYQRRFLKSNQYDWVCYGRRTLDINSCGKEGVAKGNTLNPLYDWTHEETFALIQYHDRQIEPHYFYPNGFKEYYRYPWADWLPKERSRKAMFRFVDSHVEGVYDRAIQEGLI